MTDPFAAHLGLPQTDVPQLLDDWLAKARYAKQLEAQNERWPAWSKSELLAVAVILEDTDMLADLEYTRTEALERLRYEIGEPNVLAAAAVFGVLRYKLLDETDD